MKLDSRLGIVAIGLAMLLAAAAPASAFVYVPGSGWQTFTTWADVAAPVAGYGPYGGTWDGDPENDPFTFSLFAPGYLKVTDVLMPGDYFRVFDGGALLGETPMVPFIDAVHTFDPWAAYADPDLSHAEWLLAPGTYSLQFQNIFQEYGIDRMPEDAEGAASSFFRVDPVPEPGALALLGIGLAAVGLAVRRKR